MPARLPHWVEIGALFLALVAGYVNAIGLLSFEHQSVSHLSGTATLLGAGLLDRGWLSAVHLLGVLVSFFNRCRACRCATKCIYPEAWPAL